jgi:hypothetical protein
MISHAQLQDIRCYTIVYPYNSVIQLSLSSPSFITLSDISNLVFNQHLTISYDGSDYYRDLRMALQTTKAVVDYEQHSHTHSPYYYILSQMCSILCLEIEHCKLTNKINTLTIK